MSQPKITNDQLAGPFFDIANIIRVDKDPGVGAFSSIKAAVDSVTNATAINPVAIAVGPGWYTEDTITLKPYIKLYGWAGETHTFIQPTVPTQTLVVGANSAMIQGFSLNGATGVGGTGIYYQSASNSTQGTFRISNIRFLANTTNCHLVSNGFDSYVVGDSMYFVTFSDATLTHLKIESTGTNLVECIFDSTAIINIIGANLSEAILVTGPYASATFNNVTMKALGPNSAGDGIVVQDGAHLDVLSGIVTQFKNNLVARNIGAAPVFHVAVSMSADSTTRDVSVEHPGTTGLFSGATNASKVFIDPASTVSANYSDLQSAGGTVTVGPLYMGPTHADITDASTLFSEALPVGLLSGGEITQGTNPLDINVAAGYGYVGITNSNIFVKKLTWNTTTLTLADDAVHYVYFDSNGTLTRADTPPDILSTILLGRVKTLGGIITFIGFIPNRADRLSSRLRTFSRDAIGNVFKSGCAVTENATPFHVDVGSGNYFYADLQYLPSGGTNINFFPWYIVGGNWIKSTVTNTVNHTTYNDPITGTLVPLTTGYYTKHTLWVGGEGINEQYQIIYGQTEYASLAEVQSAPLPPISSGFAEITTPIAAIIVQEGAANITEIIDIRPRIGFQNPSTSAASIHGNLAGLLADDHLQYLLVNGTRALTGNLDLGTHNITNVGTINGHTIIDAAPVGAAFVTIGSNATLSAERSLVVISNQLLLTDGGANSTVTLGLATNPILPGTGSLTLPSGTTAEQPGTPTVGMLRYNSTTSYLEYYSNSWKQVTGGIGIGQILTGPIGSGTGTTVIPYDNTIPDITEGTQIWSQVITPSKTSSLITVQFGLTIDASANNGTLIVAIFRGTTCVSTRVWNTGSGAGDRPDVMSVDYTDAPTTTSAVTYSARIGVTTGSWYYNSTSTGVTLGGTLVSTYKVSEILV